MNLRGIAARIVKGDIQYALGRFWTVRSVYGGARRLMDRRVSVQQNGSSTLFPDQNVDQIASTISEEAVFIGLNLPAHIVNEIDTFARKEPLHTNYDSDGPTFRYSDVIRGKAPDGRSAPIAGISNPTRCPAVQAIVDDPVLRAIVGTYLGHEPHKVLTILGWSFASDFSEEERRRLRHQNVLDYHYDVDGYNFVYANFYITDTDRNSGAHVMMKRSHKRKPLRMLFGSASASEASVHKQFGVENEIMIEGEAGTGFVQDTSCYHRATPPIQRDRLMLAVRFIN
ncbi:hypothetical protein IVB45_13695 [Bradyrhizobium sp. 4]|uniref:hypothetical protein n=1 Tax=unclassified Bradyrhizobium TaxID=2631580 RepID=UPI001FFA3EDF|nr:hypothetical protein [Bradyrhizobium sp. 4]MCK1403844.1 hypothetical protein [Bradyrhizobium sp. 39]MCK1750307.1 hypothetical protein [Bradyrhizobium sp. 135]UPJ37813.1 hypothetical protein IVB45_13695 [Bradyrhizobium sp. 4]